MNTLARILTVSLLVACLLSIPLANCATEGENGIIELRVHLSESNIYRGDSVLINVTVTGNLSANLTNTAVDIRVNHRDSGAIVWEVKGDLFEGKYAATFRSNDTTAFGLYYAWVSVGNITSFASFKVYPTSLDTYYELKKIEANQARQEAEFRDRDFRDSLLIAAMLMTMLFCWITYRLPDYTKKNIGDWFVSVFNTRLFRKSFGEIRDFDKKRQRRYENPTIAEKEEEKLRYDKIVLHSGRLLKSLIPKRDVMQEKLERVNDTIEDFKELREKAVRKSEEIEISIEDNIENIQKKASEKRDVNRKVGGN